MTTAATATTPTATYARLAALPLRVEAYELTALELAVNDGYTRLTTVVHLYGDGQQGQGEDTTYAPPDQVAFRRGRAGDAAGRRLDPRRVLRAPRHA